MRTHNTIKIQTGSVEFGKGRPLVLMAGPCVIESRDQTLRTAERIKSIAENENVSLVFKSSFDKANRTSLSSFRGPGLEEGLKILEEVKSSLGLPVISDIHSEEQARAAAEVLDILQIPAFLCRQTDLIVAAAKTVKPVQIKKGQFLHPSDMLYVVEKAKEAGARDISVCDRGTSFGYRELVVDFRGLSIMRETGCPVVFDATHSVQVIGGAGGKSSGNRDYVSTLSRAAVAVGVDAIFLECHEDPDTALSDGPNMLPIDQLADLLSDLKSLHSLSLRTR